MLGGSSTAVFRLRENPPLRMTGAGRKSGLGEGSGEDAGLRTPGSGTDEGVDGGGVHGFGEVETLAAGAAHGFEFFQLLGVFDALGDDIHAEGAGEGEDGADDEAGFVIVDDALDEGAVDFEGVEGEALEVVQRGVAGAEVVHVEADAEFFKGAHVALGGGGIGDEGALGDFEAEAAGLEAGLFEDAADAVDEVGLLELAGGKVDADAGFLQLLAGAMTPFDELAAGFGEAPFAEGDDEAGFFGEGDELAGREEAAAGVAPADEGFKADDAIGAEIDFGLVVHDEFAGADGAFEVGFELEAIDGALAHALGVAGDAGAFLAAGVHEGGFGVGHDFFGMGVEDAGLSDADGELGDEGVATEEDRVVEGFNETGGESGGFGFGVGAFEKDHEFGADEAGGEGGIGEESLEAGRGFDEEAFAASGAEGFIEGIEAVESDGEDGEVPVGVLKAAFEAVLEVVEEEGAVGEAGEGIGHAAGGDVAEGTGDVGGAGSGIAGENAAELDPAPGAVLVLDAVLIGDGLGFAFAEGVELDFEAELVLGVDAVEPGVEGGAGGESGDGLEARGGPELAGDEVPVPESFFRRFQREGVTIPVVGARVLLLRHSGSFPIEDVERPYGRDIGGGSGGMRPNREGDWGECHSGVGCGSEGRHLLGGGANTGSFVALLLRMTGKSKHGVLRRFAPQDDRQKQTQGPSSLRSSG
jgi:hypothetical protein